MNPSSRVLVFGFGNPGRLDDGLGPRLAEAVGRLGIDGVTADSNYQLQVEDASMIAGHEVVIFADADVRCADPFEFRRLEPAHEAEFTSHSVSPRALLGLAEETFGTTPRAYVLAIRGHEFNEFGERLSPRGEANLAAAVRFLEPLLRDGCYDEHVTDPDASGGAASG